jgi:3-methyladenine DNA glycosylase AlkC
MKKIIFTIIILAFSVFAQTETLTNSDIIQLTKIGLNKVIIITKIKASKGNFDLSVNGLSELKQNGVDDEIIQFLLSKADESSKAETQKTSNLQNEKKTQTRRDLLLAARTMLIEKQSTFPSISALEKELLKRDEWKQFNIAISQNYRSDLYMKIDFINGSVLTHRYAWQISDMKTGTIIAAGETTSWGSLAKNIARDVAQELDKVNKNKGEK